MDKKYKSLDKKSKLKCNWQADEVARNIIEFAQQKEAISQRQYAHINEIPRTTFQGWIKRIERIDSDPHMIAFLESPVGVRFLHTMICGLHFCFGKIGCSSIRTICHFLELVGLSPFVASSYGVHQKLSNQIDQALINFGNEEQKRLSKNMSEKTITLCEDETFHPDPCLVAMEPYSNFIFLEKYAGDRTGETWNKAVKQCLKGLRFKVAQCTGDEAKGLINHATKGLGAHHSPDLFHVQYEIGKGTTVALTSRIKRLEKEHENCRKQYQKALDQKQQHEKLKKQPIGRPLDYQKRIDVAAEKEQLSKKELEKARDNQKMVKDAKKQINESYHPYDVLTGQPKTSIGISRQFGNIFDRIRKASEELSDKSKKRIEKAYKVTSKMAATVAFFFFTIKTMVGDMNLTPELNKLMNDRLIPGFYLQSIIRKEKDQDRKEAIRKKSEELLSVLNETNHSLFQLDSNERQRIISTAKQCASMFQRSSSCVEGRNSQLSLRHHGHHRLSNRKLSALTVIHNYYLKRPDTTTAAERLFGNKPRDMFQFLLKSIPLPAKPRSKTKLAA